MHGHLTVSSHKAHALARWRKRPRGRSARPLGKRDTEIGTPGFVHELPAARRPSIGGGQGAVAPSAADGGAVTAVCVALTPGGVALAAGGGVRAAATITSTNAVTRS